MENGVRLRKTIGSVGTYGGFANGIPRNLLVLPSEAPEKTPLSRVTVGVALGEGVA